MGASLSAMPRKQVMKTTSSVRTIAFLGDYLPRKCGIATFTCDLLLAVAAEHAASECFAVSVNDIKGGYDYPDVVRFEIDEQDLSSYLRAADFLNISNVDIKAKDRPLPNSTITADCVATTFVLLDQKAVAAAAVAAATARGAAPPAAKK